MVHFKKGSRVSHSSITTTTTNNLMMSIPSGNISLPQEAREEHNTSTSKKRRGRPLRSQNKQKPSVEENTSMKIVFLEVPAGKDIFEALINLAELHQASLTVLGGSGLVTNVTLLRPLTRAPAFSIEGPFYMSSLSGTYINPNCVHVPPRFRINPRRSSFSIFLSGRGKVFCGFVGGTIIAVDVVIIKVVLLKKPKFHWIFNINGDYHEIEEHVETESNNNNVMQNRTY